MTTALLLRRLLRAWPVIVLTALLGVLAAAIGNAVATPSYRATVELYATSATATTDLSNLYQGGLYAQQQAVTYAQVIDSPTVLSGVITSTRAGLTVDELERRVDVAVRPETALISVAVSSADPREARRLANAVAAASTRIIPTLDAPRAASRPSVAVTILQRAQLPNSPATPRTTLNLALGLLAGGFVGLLVVLARILLDPAVRSAEQLSRAAGTPALAEVPGTGGVPRRPGPGPPALGTREAADRLQTSLAMIDPSAQRRSIVVSSPTQDARQGLVAAQLALALARSRDARVALVDADLRAPDLEEQVGVFPHRGLTDVLSGAISLSNALLGVPRTGVTLLSAGVARGDPSDVIGSRGMNDILRTLENDFDYVVVKAPPMLPVSDAAVLSALTDATILVALRGETRQQEVSDATRSLYAVRAKIVGCVLTYGVDGPRPFVRGAAPEPAGAKASSTGVDEGRQPASGATSGRQASGKPGR